MPALLDSVAFCWNQASKSFDEVPADSLKLSLYDAGSLFGATLVERFRTFGGKLFDPQRNLKRLARGATVLQVKEPAIWDRLHIAIPHLIAANQSVIERVEDVSIVIVLTPGDTRLKGDSAGPTCFLHIDLIPFARLSRWYQYGTSLQSGITAAVPNVCWPTSIKTRCRLPYYLSDMASRSSNEDSLGLLRTVSGHVADTSVANILIVKQDASIVSPRREDVLQGCSMELVSELLSYIGRSIEYRNVDFNELIEAREVLLVGSIGCVWQASSLDGKRIGIPNQDGIVSLTESLQGAWMSLVGHNFVAQSVRVNAS